MARRLTTETLSGTAQMVSRRGLQAVVAVEAHFTVAELLMCDTGASQNISTMRLLGSFPILNKLLWITYIFCPMRENFLGHYLRIEQEVLSLGIQQGRNTDSQNRLPHRRTGS